MTTQTKTLAQVITTSLLNGKVQSENDLITIARIVMTDLAIDFTTALRFVNDVITATLSAQDQLLNK